MDTNTHKSASASFVKIRVHSWLRIGGFAPLSFFAKKLRRFLTKWKSAGDKEVKARFKNRTKAKLVGPVGFEPTTKGL